MPAISGHLFFPLFVALTFIAAVLLFEALFLLWNGYRGPEAKRIAQRLRGLSGTGPSGEQAILLKHRPLSEVPVVARLLHTLPNVERFDRFILQSGLDWTIGKLALFCLLLGACTYAATLGWRHLLPDVAAWLLTAAAAMLPLMYVQYRRARRLRQLDRQLPDALDLISRSLRAGHAFAAGLKMVGEEMAQPIAGEFSMTHDEINYGVTLQEALGNLGRRIPNTDLRYFIIAVMIQRETGGNLSEVLGNLSQLIRSRLKLQAKIRVLTAEGRLSAWTLGLMPFILAGVMRLGNPEFISVLWTEPAGIKLTQITLSVMAVGAFWLWRITRVRV